jgi:hypothetical protein
MLQAAVRGVIRSALEEVAELGLPGEHHFFIQIRTDHPDVSLPAFLRQRYPEEMTIALQHQFWGLMVDEEAFSVTLAFEGSRHSVTVPFEAVIAFADPAAEFTLQLKPILPSVEEPPAAEEAAPEDAEEKGSVEGEGARVVDFESFRKR